MLYTLPTEQDVDGGIIYSYIEKTAVPKQQLSVTRNIISFNEGVPEDFKKIQDNPCLIIVEDLLNDVYPRKCAIYLRKGVITEISVSFR